jgi:RimJ/RimL family protein N-acetyltransferase
MIGRSALPSQLNNGWVSHDAVDVPVLSDGVVQLTALELGDVEEHVANEDDETVRWLTEGHRSTVESTVAWVERNLVWWRDGGPRRLFAIRDVASGRLAGMIEANLDSASCGLPPGEVNISYEVYPWVRGRGYAVRALRLTCTFLQERVDSAEVAVLQIHPDNASSLKVPSKAGFADAGWTGARDKAGFRYFRRQLL